MTLQIKKWILCKLDIIKRVNDDYSEFCKLLKGSYFLEILQIHKIADIHDGASQRHGSEDAHVCTNKHTYIRTYIYVYVFYMYVCMCMFFICI